MKWKFKDNGQIKEVSQYSLPVVGCLPIGN